MVLVLLTLEKHKEGIWVTKLASALRDVGRDEEVSIVPIEKFLLEAPSVNQLFRDTTGIINRVSDAADPIAFKLAVSLLTAARHCGIPVFNGPDAYTLCANKFCHHLVLEKAGVQTPPSRILTSGKPEDLQKCINASGKLRYPLLIKPNAGGFGAGIHRLDVGTEVTKEHLSTPDGIRLVQNFIHPKDDHIYRVWFLNGQVQCGVKRKVGDTKDDLTTGCSGGLCQRPPTAKELPFTAFSIPTVIQEDVKRIVTQLPDAHAGSIEYLYNDKEEPLYFDLNLLSTLPLIEKTALADEIWGPEYDPWTELARGVLCVCQLSEEDSSA